MDIFSSGRPHGKWFLTRLIMNLLFILAMSFVIVVVIYKVDFQRTYEELLVRTNMIPQILKSDDTVEVLFDDVMRNPYTLKQDDPKLIQKIRKEYLMPPSEEEYPLFSKNDPSMGQSMKIREILGDKRNGFFIECGALDGETRSNTLVFEKMLGWRGVLIEGDPRNYGLMLKRHRKSWTVNACLSPLPYPHAVMFRQQFNVGKISDENLDHDRQGYTEVQCFNIYSILLALNVTNVDYFSLDVEGHELAVLKTIPWDKVNITTLSVEFAHVHEGKNSLRSYMENLGYVVHSLVTHPGSLANDFIFYHPKLLGHNSTQ